MKMKSFAMLVMPGLFAASLAYIAPAMADDMNSGSGQSMQQSAPSDNNSMGSGMSPTNDNSNSDNSGNSGSTDQGSPDTATGDDDY